MLKDEIIGENIRRVRVVGKFSQEKLGKKIGLSKQTISKIEKGKRKVTASELLDIANYLGKNINSFFSKEYFTEELDNQRVTYKKIDKRTNKVIETKTLFLKDISFGKDLDNVIDDIKNDDPNNDYKIDLSKSGLFDHLEELNYFNVLFLDSIRKGLFKIEEKEEFLVALRNKDKKLLKKLLIETETK